MTPRRAFRSLVLDVRPLRRSSRFRKLFLGQLLAFVGRQMTVVAVPYQAYLLTESTLVVGLLGFIQFIPLIVASVLGGAVIDAVDRRKVLVVSQILLAGTAVGLAVNAADRSAEGLAVVPVERAQCCTLPRLRQPSQPLRPSRPFSIATSWFQGLLSTRRLPR